MVSPTLVKGLHVKLILHYESKAARMETVHHTYLPGLVKLQFQLFFSTNSAP
ncbi:hypothetical protein GA0061103_5100 [Rhizobium multihospitium]|uniref:Uncharacterized protein n=1 Tax=Rhizobium multihospitium TaxID=410764 RepID=A0A1C3W9L0_9HYPH|nr:hypothetical protein GA0061103_5100 [Rhizobium multihospitium]